MNPLFNAMNPAGNMPGVLQQFNQFRQMFRGDARQQVQQMLNSGRVSQAQYNQAVQMANRLRQMMTQTAGAQRM